MIELVVLAGLCAAASVPQWFEMERMLGALLWFWTFGLYAHSIEKRCYTSFGPHGNFMSLGLTGRSHHFARREQALRQRQWLCGPGGFTIDVGIEYGLGLIKESVVSPSRTSHGPVCPGQRLQPGS